MSDMTAMERAHRFTVMLSEYGDRPSSQQWLAFLEEQFDECYSAGFAKAIEMAAAFCADQGEYDGEWFAEKIKTLKPTQE